MNDRLAIPYITNTGIIQIRFRAVPTDGVVGGPCESPKYKSETNAPTTMYNVMDFSSQGIIGITEGEPDTWTVKMMGIPVIGLPGAETWEKNASVFSRAFRYRKALIFADNDDDGSGVKFAKSVQKWVKGSKIILMPKGYDTNSFYCEFGIDALKEKAGLDGA